MFYSLNVCVDHLFKNKGGEVSEQISFVMDIIQVWLALSVCTHIIFCPAFFLGKVFQCYVATK